jgi:hypothetical protein
MSPTEVIVAELSEVQKIIINETRLASERAGYSIDPHNPQIHARVAEVILSGTAAPSQEEAAAKLGIPIATLRMWLSRLRQRYREALRREWRAQFLI